jgi:hypothetical protein
VNPRARTFLAAGLVGVIGLAVVGGGAWFLGFPTEIAVRAGVFTGAVSAGLLIAVARRAERFHDPDGRGGAIGHPGPRNDH